MKLASYIENRDDTRNQSILEVQTPSDDESGPREMSMTELASQFNSTSLTPSIDLNGKKNEEIKEEISADPSVEAQEEYDSDIPSELFSEANSEDFGANDTESEDDYHAAY